ncbi:hypothetical protein [Candidatus Vidania fulgoroideorum]
MKIKVKYLDSFLFYIKEIYRKEFQDILIFGFNKFLVFRYINRLTNIYSINNLRFNDGDCYCVTYNKIYNIVRNLDNNNHLHIKKKKQKIHLCSNNFSFISYKSKSYKNINILLPNDLKNSIIFKSKRFLKSLNYNIHNIRKFNNEETGLNIIMKGRKIILFSTDGFTMSLYSYPSIYKGDLSFNISKSITKTLINLLSKSNSETFSINFSYNCLYFFIDNNCIETKEYKEVIINHKIFSFSEFYKLKIPFFSFKKIIKLFFSLYPDNPINIYIKKNNIFFYSTNNINEEIKDSIKIKGVVKEINLRFNLRYLMDFIILGKRKIFFYIYYKKENFKVFFMYSKSNYKKLIMPIHY